MDLNISIRQHYQQLSDEQLLVLYEKEIAGLTPAARTLLLDEIKRRKIPLELWQEKQTSPMIGTAAEEEQIKKMLLFFETGWGKAELRAYGLLHGLTTSDMDHLFQGMVAYLLKRLKATASIMTNGILFFVIGLSVRSLPLNSDQHKAVILLCYLFMLFGFIRVLHGYLMKRRMRSLIEKWDTSPDDLDGIAVPAGEE